MVREKLSLDVGLKRENSLDKPRKTIEMDSFRLRYIKRTLKRNQSIRNRKTAAEHSISRASVWRYCRKSNKNPDGLFPYKPKKKITNDDKSLSKKD